jgi:hypothetical protein
MHDQQRCTVVSRLGDGHIDGYAGVPRAIDADDDRWPGC